MSSIGVKLKCEIKIDPANKYAHFYFNETNYLQLKKLSSAFTVICEDFDDSVMFSSRFYHGTFGKLNKIYMIADLKYHPEIATKKKTVNLKIYPYGISVKRPKARKMVIKNRML